MKRVGEPGGTKSRMIRQTRDQFTRALEAELDAHVEGDPGAAHYCPGCQAAAAAAITLKKCKCGWAIERRGGRWLHVQTRRTDCPTPAETSQWRQDRPA